MVKDGKWRIIRPGEAVPASGAPTGGGSPRPGPSPSPSPSAPASAFGPVGGTSVGAIAGVASRSKETSLRLFNGRTRYDQWLFLANQPRRLGRDRGPNTLPGGAGGLPRPSPSPRR